MSDEEQKEIKSDGCGNNGNFIGILSCEEKKWSAAGKQAAPIETMLPIITVLQNILTTVVVKSIRSVVVTKDTHPPKMNQWLFYYGSRGVHIPIPKQRDLGLKKTTPESAILDLPSSPYVGYNSSPQKSQTCILKHSQL